MGMDAIVSTVVNGELVIVDIDTEAGVEINQCLI